MWNGRGDPQNLDNQKIKKKKKKHRKKTCTSPNFKNHFLSHEGGSTWLLKILVYISNSRMILNSSTNFKLQTLGGGIHFYTFKSVCFNICSPPPFLRARKIHVLTFFVIFDELCNVKMTNFNVICTCKLNKFYNPLKPILK